jgi:uncharacterized protein (DUF362 family)
MRKFTRREFLKIGAAISAAASIPLIIKEYKESEPPPPTPTPPSHVPSPSPQINAQVVAVKGNDLYEMARNLLTELGGMDTIVQQGETVFIKPNMCSLPWAPKNKCFAMGEVTKVEILVAVAEECLKAGATEVIIGDCSHLYTFDWSAATTLDGSTNLVDEAARLNEEYPGTVSLCCLETQSPSWVEVPSLTPMGSILISGWLTEADRVISIPVAKTHCWAQLTLALKNFIGVISLERYAQWVSPGYYDRGFGLDHSSPQAIAQIYLDIVDAVRPDLSIIDFSIGIEGDGPAIGHGGSSVDMKSRLGSWLLLGSTDIMAADATAARVMSHDVHEIHQLRMGYEMGLGEINEASIELKGESLSDLQVPWKAARLRN